MAAAVSKCGEQWKINAASAAAAGIGVAVWLCRRKHVARLMKRQWRLNEWRISVSLSRRYY
jgi:hypothetical protein